LNKKIILLRLFIIAVIIVASSVYKSKRGLVSEQTISPKPTAAVLLSPTPILTPIPSNSDYQDNTIALTSELQDEMFGKWKAKFYAWDRTGREEWDPMVLDKKVVTLSKDEVTYLDYEIKNPKFYCTINYIDDQATFHQYPQDITKFQEDIIDISILAEDESTFPDYYRMGFVVIGSKKFIWYQGAYFEIEKLDVM
jgi:hypothetical protein